MDLINNQTNEEIVKNNTIFLQQLNGVHIKRISRECNNLYKFFPNIVLSSISDKIEMIVTEGNSKYGFIFNNNYPFTAPQIYYNGESYLELLKINGNEEKNVLRKYRSKDCLCCDSYYCRDNWYPALSLKSIIDEIKEIIELKQTIMQILLADIIKKKYLINDIDINSFLI
jgi:ubiquitin-protein ligase